MGTWFASAAAVRGVVPSGAAHRAPHQHGRPQDRREAPPLDVPQTRRAHRAGHRCVPCSWNDVQSLACPELLERITGPNWFKLFAAQTLGCVHRIEPSCVSTHAHTRHQESTRSPNLLQECGSTSCSSWTSRASWAMPSSSPSPRHGAPSTATPTNSGSSSYSRWETQQEWNIIWE